MPNDSEKRVIDAAVIAVLKVVEGLADGTKKIEVTQVADYQRQPGDEETKIVERTTTYQIVDA